MPVDIIIRKQKFRVRAHSQEAALEVRQQLNDSLQYEVIAMMEDVFSGINTTGSYININSIKVDLGAISSEDFDSDFIRLLAPKFAQAVKEQLHTHTSTINPEDHANPSSPLAQNTQPAASISQTQQQLNTLVHFLQFGVLPWWYTSPNETPTVLLQLMTEGEIDSLLTKLYVVIRAAELTTLQRVVARLFNSLSTQQYVTFTSRMTVLINDPSLTTNIQVLQQEAPAITQLFSLNSQTYFTELFTFVVQQPAGKPGGTANTIHDFLQHLVATFGAPKKEQHESDLNGLSPRLAEPLAQFLKQATIPQNKTDETQQSEAENTSGSKDRKEETPSPISPLAEEGLFISNAGLVILHPFLKTLFQALNLLNAQDDFISNEQKYRAAVVLYYLQSGSQEYQEWEMAFNKILCNLPIEEVLPNNITLSAQEISECDDLLQTVIRYWEALKGAGVQAVQQTFITRPGKLTFKQDHWLLQVERTGTDILLDRLPWGFTTVKLPWLPNLIFTEW